MAGRPAVTAVDEIGKLLRAHADDAGHADNLPGGGAEAELPDRLTGQAVHPEYLRGRLVARLSARLSRDVAEHEPHEIGL